MACAAHRLWQDVVWFGESLPQEEWETAIKFVQSCSLLLIVGTSGVVYPAAHLPFLAKRMKAWKSLSNSFKILVNLSEYVFYTLSMVYTTYGMSLISHYILFEYHGIGYL